MTTPARPYRDLSGEVTVRIPARVLGLDPIRPAEGTLPPVLLGLHGYAMDAASMLPLLRRMVPDESWMIVALQGPHTTLVPGTEETADRRRGFHWGVSPRPEETRAAHREAVSGALDWIASHRGDVGRVSLVGFSQPCSFNYRLAAAPPDGLPFAGVVALCGGVPSEWTGPGDPTPASAATDVLHVSTNHDPYYPAERIAPYRGILASRFRSAEHVLFDGGHRIPSASLPKVRAFLEAALVSSRH